MAPPGQGGNPTAIKPAIASSARRGEVCGGPRGELGRRVGVDQAVVLVRAECLLAARLAAEHQPAVRHGRPTVTPLGQCRFRLRENPRRDAIVQLGDDARDVPHPPAVAHEALHQGGHSGGAAGQRLTRRRVGDVACQRHGMNSLGHQEVVAGQQARDTTGLDHHEMMDFPPRHLEQGLERERLRRDRSERRRHHVAGRRRPASRRAATTLVRRSRSVTMPSGATVGPHHHDGGTGALHERGHLGHAGPGGTRDRRAAEEVAYPVDEDRKLADFAHRARQRKKTSVTTTNSGRRTAPL